MPRECFREPPYVEVHDPWIGGVRGDLGGAILSRACAHDNLAERQQSSRPLPLRRRLDRAGTFTGTASPAGLPPSALYDAASRADFRREDPDLLVLVGAQELLLHPAEDVVDDARRCSDVRVVRHPWARTVERDRLTADQY
jgi:hypothetical protein